MTSLKGSLLIAAPGLMDPNFVRTVVLVAEHNEEGALGVILNRPMKTRVADLWAALTNESATTAKTAFLGGPVQKEHALLLLHGHEEVDSEAEPILPGVYMASTIDILGRLLHRPHGAAEETTFRVYCGYSGWGPGQLDGEMRQGGWLTCAATPRHIFSEEPERLWSSTISSLGEPYTFFSFMPPNPEMN